jgi:hypothetical protein
MLNWILVPLHIEILLGILAGLTPVCALAAWSFASARVAVANSNLRVFWLLAASGPLVWILWRAYNAIEDALGLDSLLALGINAALFLLVGTAIGFWLRAGEKRSETSKVQSGRRSGKT